ncbi:MULTISPECIES: hypothetical protein [Kitasatospora]|uniref:Lipoprotein n=1 Tax=Kitasatospora cathayae TaxID=3004092 RepID=A0ABY7QE84_9ACTN|nr:hypothetical protein [Kitasatospora sp. HUAS 3-15]WBP91015.1 hypothetical protein O1G21_37540 [Kitasatospora sp. HUAS 3-15]
MSIRHLGAAARVIGRRNALRYLAIGAGSALVAACSSSTGSSSGDGGQAAPPAPTATAPTPTDAVKPTVADRAFDAFVRGDWNVKTSTSRGKTLPGKVTVQTDGGGNGGWTIAWEGLSGKAATWRGNFLLRGGHLSLNIVDGPGTVSREHAPEALNVPATVGGSVQLTLPWQPPGSTDSTSENLAVTYDGTTLTIVHTAGSSKTTHTCTRA